LKETIRAVIAATEPIRAELKETIPAVIAATEPIRAELKETIRAVRAATEPIRAELKETIRALRAATEPIRAELDETTATQEATEANAEKTEPDTGMMQSIAEHQVACKEDAVVKPVKGRKKRLRGRKPAAGRCGEPKKLTRGDCGSGKKLAAACRKVSSCATVAWRKRNLLRKIRNQENCGPRKEFAAAGIRTTRCAKLARGREHGLQRQGNDNIAPRSRKGRTEENKRYSSSCTKQVPKYL
jgi:hypothetical protein